MKATKSKSFYISLGCAGVEDFLQKIRGEKELYRNAEQMLNADLYNGNIKDNPANRNLLGDTQAVLFSLYFTDNENNYYIKGGLSRNKFLQTAIETLYL